DGEAERMAYLDAVLHVAERFALAAVEVLVAGVGESVAQPETERAQRPLVEARDADAVDVRRLPALERRSETPLAVGRERPPWKERDLELDAGDGRQGVGAGGELEPVEIRLEMVVAVLQRQIERQVPAGYRCGERVGERQRVHLDREPADPVAAEAEL